MVNNDTKIKVSQKKNDMKIKVLVGRTIKTTKLKTH